ncbi:ATP-binding protein [Halegenticoccus soli]|uniref:ATP-binding protein n=1 Tax=Halegenticoccus soli TaxID=1985678 RepID=UPI00117ACCAF
MSDRRKESTFGEDERGPDSSGMGIGLYLVEQLVAQYGDRIWSRTTNLRDRCAASNSGTPDARRVLRGR